MSGIGGFLYLTLFSLRFEALFMEDNMKTEHESKSIQKCLDKLVEFLDTVSEETNYNYSYPIEEAHYDNDIEQIIITYENGEERIINVAIDSVAASMKDAIKHAFMEVYD